LLDKLDLEVEEIEKLDKVISKNARRRVAEDISSSDDDDVIDRIGTFIGENKDSGGKLKDKGKKSKKKFRKGSVQTCKTRSLP